MTRLIDADALDWERIEHEHGARHEAVVDCEQMVEKAPTIDAVPATIEGALGYLHKVGWMQEHDRIMTEDAVPVVRCKECKWWTKQEKSIQGRCALTGTYPTGGWYCGNGKREDDD